MYGKLTSVVIGLASSVTEDDTGDYSNVAGI